MPQVNKNNRRSNDALNFYKNMTLIYCHKRVKTAARESKARERESQRNQEVDAGRLRLTP